MNNSKTVLFVCTANQLRSPTAARLACQLTDWDVRSCGDWDEALIPLTGKLLLWADEVICMEQCHADTVDQLVQGFFRKPKVTVWNIPDHFDYMDPKLVKIIADKLKERNDTGKV